MRGVWCLPVAMVAIALAGCSTEGKTGTVTGTVTVDGKPAEGIALTFAHADGRVATAASDAQGNYTAANVPVGDVTVTAYVVGQEREDAGMIIKNRGAADPSRPPPTDPKKKGPKLATKFGDPNTSGLRHQATEGESKFNVPLTTQK